MNRLLTAIFLCFFASTAFAQQGNVKSTGALTPGHAARWVTSGAVIGDAGGAAGSSTNGSGYLTELGVTNTGLPVCINDALTNAAGGYHRLCFGANSLGGGLISYDALGGALPLPLQLIVNGVTLPIPGSVTGLTAVANLATLKAITVGSASIVYREGYTTAGDGGAAYYIYSGSACSLNAGAGDNGSQVAPNIGSGCWIGLFANDIYNVLIFGADPSGAIDSSTSLRNAVDAAQGKQVFLPQGMYKSCTLVTTTYPLWLSGAGPGIGPGLVNTGSASIISLCGTTQSGFQSTSFYGSVFENFQLIGPAQSAGIGIQLLPAGSAVVAQPLFRNIAIGSPNFLTQGIFNPIQITRPNWPIFEGVYCQGWVSKCISLTTSTGIEGAGGHIAHSYFFGDPCAGLSSTTASCPVVPATPWVQGPGIYSEVGYTDIHDNEILAGIPGGVEFCYKNNPAGFSKVHDNTIENFLNEGVLISSCDGSAASMVMIQNNEFSNFAFATDLLASIVIQEYDIATVSQKYLDTVVISGNVHRNVMPDSARKYIWVQTGQNVKVENETITDLGGHAPIGVQMTGAVSNAGFTAPLSVLDNSYSGIGLALSLTQSATLRDVISGFLVANLPSSAANGSQIWTTDGAPGSGPCTGSSTGAMAFRQNGAWKCF